MFELFQIHVIWLYEYYEHSFPKSNNLPITIAIMNKYITLFGF